MKTVLFNIFLVIFLTIQIQSQQFSIGSPEWLVDMFFNQNEFPDKEKYLSGEMLDDIDELTIGEELNDNAVVLFHQVKGTENDIVFSVEVNQDNNPVDFYCYINRSENKWKISALRTFVLPSFIYIVRDSLSNLNNLSSNDSTFLLSLQLFTATDNELKNFLKTNQNNFNKLISAFINNQKDEGDKILSSIGCNAIYSDKNFPGCIFIQILKFEDLSAGFIQAADPILLPRIAVEDFILIEEVVQGWFIYRLM